MRTGIDRATGRVLTGWDHCAQSICDIVTTAIGSRVIARDYGSHVPALQDRPMNEATVTRHFSAIAEALQKWEPGFRLDKVSVVTLAAGGVAAFAMSGTYYPNGYLGDYSVSIAGVNVLAALPSSALS